MIRRDLAPIIARVIVEHPPKTCGPQETIAWALRNWPTATYEEAHRAMQIAIELVCFDLIAWDVE